LTLTLYLDIDGITTYGPVELLESWGKWSGRSIRNAFHLVMCKEFRRQRGNRQAANAKPSLKIGEVFFLRGIDVRWAILL
jgi:hypothetical protein